MLLGFSIAATSMLSRWSIQINQYLGIKTSVASGEGEDVFKSDYDEIEDLFAAKSDLIGEIGREGCVLLKNDNDALPLSSGAKVSIFGRSSTNMMFGEASGGGNIKAKCDDIKTVFTSEGLKVNETLWNFYKGISGRVRYTANDGMQLGEARLDEYTQQVRDSYPDYNDAVFIVLTRAFGEGIDASRDPSIIKDGDGTHNALQIQDIERDMIYEANAPQAATEK